MGQYGAAGAAVDYLIRRAGELTMDEAADIYQASATRLLLDGSAAGAQSRAHARRAAVRTGRLPQYEQARHAAASAWRAGLPEVQGPWLLVGSAIANAAGALVLQDVLDAGDLVSLLGPWRQAIGTMMPVGPGQRSPEPSTALIG